MGRGPEKLNAKQSFRTYNAPPDKTVSTTAVACRDLVRKTLSCGETHVIQLDE